MKSLKCFNKLMIFPNFKRKREKDANDERENKNNLLCRFVFNGSGKKVGESIAVDEDVLIIKSDEKYLGIPLKHIEQEEKTILVKGLVDQDKAEIMGERWRKKSFKKIEGAND